MNANDRTAIPGFDGVDIPHLRLTSAVAIAAETAPVGAADLIAEVQRETIAFPEERE
jgi:hypothetical protein